MRFFFFVFFRSFICAFIYLFIHFFVTVFSLFLQWKTYYFCSTVVQIAVFFCIDSFIYFFIKLFIHRSFSTFSSTYSTFIHLFFQHFFIILSIFTHSFSYMNISYSAVILNSLIHVWMIKNDQSELLDSFYLFCVHQSTHLFIQCLLIHQI